jgi:acetylornithine deacetylase/succinyl-diaminopimelate desuccinylase-like protein
MTNNVEDIIKIFEQKKSDYLSDLKDLVKIPSVSFEGFDKNEVLKSAEHTAELMKKYGLENVEVIPFKGAHPYVYGDWLHAKNAPTLLLYAHHDVQPPGRLEIWKSPPFEPTERDGRLYGRGAADDKAGIMCHLAAIGSFLKGKNNGELPLNIKIIIEGEEEIGSEHLSAFLESHKKQLQADVMVLTDTSNFDVGVPALTVALRGLVVLAVEVRSLKGSVHSGMWGGPLPDPVIALSKIISKLVDDQGVPAIPGLLDKVKALSQEQRLSLEKLDYNEKEFRKQSGMLDKTCFVGGHDSVYAKLWHLPSISVNAIEASSKKMAANIINDVAWARIGIRLVPDMNPKESLELLKNFILAEAPWGVDVKFSQESTGGWWATEPKGPAFDAAKVALKKGYGVEPVMMGSGGSIPFVQPFSDALGGAPALLIGVEDPFTNAHSENESLHIGDWEKACKSAIYLYSDLSTLKSTLSQQPQQKSP